MDLLGDLEISQKLSGFKNYSMDILYINKTKLQLLFENHETLFRNGKWGFCPRGSYIMM